MTKVLILCFYSIRREIFELLATFLNCCLSSSVRALFSFEVIVLFLFKVYVKQSRTWDNLPKSKKEIFVTITSIVVFCWAMILHTQHPPKNFVFLSVRCWLHLVPDCSSLFQVVSSCSRCFQLNPAHSLFYYAHKKLLKKKLRLSKTPSSLKRKYAIFTATVPKQIICLQIWYCELL